MRNIQNRSFKIWTIPLVLSFVASAGALSPAQAGLLGISEKEEIQAGQQVRQQAYKEYGRPLAANNPMAQRVRALGQKFAALSTRKNIPYSYEVLQNDKLLNAFAAPGGPVFVTTKLVNTAANDAELAYVLGHETAHIDREHIVKSIEKQQKVGLFIGIAGAILGGGKSNSIGTIANFGWGVISRGYSRDQERESDIVGTRWMSQLGFDPNAAVSMLGRLGDGGGGGLDKYLASHPAPKDRQENVRKLIESEKLEDVARRSGGPRLTDTSLPKYSYNNTATSSGNLVDTRINDDDEGEGERVSFNGQLLLSQRDGRSTIMAPANAVARWADADIEMDGRNSNVVTITRGGNSIRLRRNATTAVVNGRTVTLSAPAAIYNNTLYAPLGTLAEGVGATADLADDNRTILISLDGRRFYANVPYR